MVRSQPLNLSSFVFPPLLLLKIRLPLPTFGRGSATSGITDGGPRTWKALTWAHFRQPGLWAFTATPVTSASGQARAILPAQRARDSARHVLATPEGLAHACLFGLSAQQKGFSAGAGASGACS